MTIITFFNWVVCVWFLRPVRTTHARIVRHSPHNRNNFFFKLLPACWSIFEHLLDIASLPRSLETRMVKSVNGRVSCAYLDSLLRKKLVENTRTLPFLGRRWRSPFSWKLLVKNPCVFVSTRFWGFQGPTNVPSIRLLKSFWFRSLSKPDLYLSRRKRGNVTNTSPPQP